jgi:hypothetical protein
LDQSRFTRVYIVYYANPSNNEEISMTDLIKIVLDAANDIGGKPDGHWTVTFNTGNSVTGCITLLREGVYTINDKDLGRIFVFSSAAVAYVYAAE